MVHVPPRLKDKLTLHSSRSIYVSHVSPAPFKKKQKKNEPQKIRGIHCTNSGCGKTEAYINWSMVISEKAAPVTGTTLRTTGPVPADTRE